MAQKICLILHSEHQSPKSTWKAGNNDGRLSRFGGENIGDVATLSRGLAWSHSGVLQTTIGKGFRRLIDWIHHGEEGEGA